MLEQGAPTAELDEVKGKLSVFGMMFGKKKDPVVARAAPDESLVDLSSFPLLDLSELELDREVARLLPVTVARSIHGICIGRPSPDQITVAVKDPSQVHVLDHISFATQDRYRATLVRAEEHLLNLARTYVYEADEFAATVPWRQWLERKKFETTSLDVKTAARVVFGAEDVTSPIIDRVDRIVKEAISLGASDIHLETFESQMVVRYRVDGVLETISTIDHGEAPAVVKRLKIMANMDIAQDRVCQGGRISVRAGGEEMDLRVSIVPVPFGENVVMRLLKKGAFNLTLSDLGFAPQDEGRLRRLLAQPYGMILVSGPTGSGKSTTLYASLKELARPDRKLLTVEDPIEYQMPGVSQIQVNLSPREEEKRVTFARALREFLRQDPDVILVGEIRDQETAGISVQAALTGHVLLSTIHTNDSIGIVARLRDMSVEPFLISSTLLGGVAQRLARRICPECREEVPVPKPMLETFWGAGVEEPRMFHGRGCRECHETGFKGRVGLYEILEITPGMRELVNRQAQAEEMRVEARSNGFRTLLEDGLTKVAAGLTPLDEVQRVCMTI